MNFSDKKTTINSGFNVGFVNVFTSKKQYIALVLQYQRLQVS